MLKIKEVKLINNVINNKIKEENDVVIVKEDISIKMSDSHKYFESLMDNKNVSISNAPLYIAGSYKLKRKISHYINMVYHAKMNDKEIPMLILSGADGMGKESIVEYIKVKLKNAIENNCSEIKLNPKVDELKDLAKKINASEVKNKFNYLIIQTDDDGVSALSIEYVRFLNRVIKELRAFNPHHIHVDMKYFTEKEDIQDLVNSFCDDLGLVHTKKKSYPDAELVLSKLLFRKPSDIYFLLSQIKGECNVQCKPFNLREIKDYIEVMGAPKIIETNDNIAIIEKPNKNLDDLIVSSDIKKEIQTLINKVQIMGNSNYAFLKNLRKADKRLVAMFSGEPGTGKSMTCEIIASELKKELWTVDFSKVFGRYVGDTEKQLTKVFNDAMAVGAVLRIDEADTLLYNRSLVSASFERKFVNHALNLIENYNGIVLMTTNHLDIIDEAMDRRIESKIVFKNPTKDEMVVMIDKMLKPDAPLSEDFNTIEALKGVEPMSGGYIRNAIETAFYKALETNGVITHELLNKTLLNIQETSNKVGFKNRKKVGLKTGE